MSAIRRQRITPFCMAGTCLFAGSAVYVLFRPTTLLMFHWADALNLTHSVQKIRDSASGLELIFPAWFVLSLPFALWVLAYLFLIDSVWADSKSPARFVWFWCVPLLAIIAELAQAERIIPGCFDWADLTAIMFAIILGVFATSIHHPKKEKEIHE
jgi:hypothetical protein